jgi:outer membrane protein
MRKHVIAVALAAGATLLAAGSAQAQSAGQAMVKVGWNWIMPKVESGDLSPPSLPGTKIDIKSASAPIITLAYMFTDNMSMEFLGGLPYKHDIEGAGAIAGVGTIGTVHQISPTLLGQYRFLQPDAQFRPYVGIGVTYAVFYDTEGSSTLTAMTNPGGPPTLIGGDHSWGGTGELGLTYKIDNAWFIDASVLKTFISTTTSLSTGQSLTAKLNPVSANISVGYRF